MDHVKISLIFIIILSLMLKECTSHGYKSIIPNDWIDPTDMRNYDPGTKCMKEPTTPTQFNQSMELCMKQKKDVESQNTYLRRIINLLLSGVCPKNKLKDDITTEHYINMALSPEQLARLHELRRTMNQQNLNELNDILSQFIMKCGVNNEINSLLNEMYIAISTLTWEKYAIIYFGTVFFVGILILKRKSVKQFIIYIFSTFYMASILWNTKYKYDQETVRQLAYLRRHGEIPEHCSNPTPSFFSWRFFSYTYLFGYEQESCDKWYEMNHIDPITRVSPILIFVETTSAMLIEPVKSLGIGIGHFIRGVSDSAPWPMNIVFLPIILILLGMFILVIFGTRIKFSSLLFSISFDSHSNNSNVIGIESTNPPSIHRSSGSRIMNEERNNEFIEVPSELEDTPIDVSINSSYPGPDTHHPRDEGRGDHRRSFDRVDGNKKLQNEPLCLSRRRKFNQEVNKLSSRVHRTRSLPPFRRKKENI